MADDGWTAQNGTWGISTGESDGDWTETFITIWAKGEVPPTPAGGNGIRFVLMYSTPLENGLTEYRFRGVKD